MMDCIWHDCMWLDLLGVFCICLAIVTAMLWRMV